MSAVAAVFGLFFSLLASAGDVRKAQAELTDGVSGIRSDGLPGTVLVLGENAFGIARAINWDGTATHVAAGAFYGEGRSVYLGHPCFLDRGKVDDETRRFVLNAVKWLAKGKVAPKLGVFRHRGAMRTAKDLFGLDVSFFEDVNQCGDYDVVLSVDFAVKDAPALVEYVKKGGGLLGAGLGWGWKQISERNGPVSFADDFGDNRVYGPMGILMGDIGVQPTKDGAFTTDTDKSPRGTYVDEALRIAVGGQYKDKRERKQVAVTLSQTGAVLPPTLPEGMAAKFSAFGKMEGVNLVPSPGKPVEIDDVFSRLAVLARKAEYESDRLRDWPADPSAASYPGLVKPGTPTITREVPVDLSVPKWHSTGFFAVAGRRVRVTLPAGAEKLRLRLRIGTTTEDISGVSQGWIRFPQVAFEVTLDKPIVEVTSPFGGLAYIVVPDNQTIKQSNNPTILLSGGVMAPWFKKGRDTNEKFAKECSETGAPQGEIEGDSYIVTSETVALKKCDDPQWIADYWDKVLAEDLRVSGGGVRRYPERFCSDLQLTSGFLHNGYPLMGHIDRSSHEDIAVSKERLSHGDGWGIYHEIGHNHQNPDWTPDGTGEVTCNIFTLLAINRVSGRDYRDNDFVTARRASAAKVRRWVSSGKKFQKFKDDYFLALEFYARLIDAFGWEAFAKTFTAYRQPGFVRPKDDTDKWNVFAREFSKTANANVAEVMALWSMPVSDETLTACSKYPKAPEALFADLTVAPYVAPKTEPVAGEYMGVCLAGDKAGEIELYATRADIPEGEKSERWKGDWMLLRRIEAHKTRLGNGGKGREVEFTRPYYIGVYEVTRQQWYNVAGEWKGAVGTAAGKQEHKPANDIANVTARGGDNDGVRWPKTGHKVSGRSFLGKLRELTGFRAEFDLPTEAQWEAACRAGTTGWWNNGGTNEPYKAKRPWVKDREIECDHVLDKLGRYFGNGPEVDGPAVVGSYLPNAWGLYDMHGNVYEQTLDYMTWGVNSFPTCCGKDPVGPLEPTKGDGDKRAIMGGSFWNDHYGRPCECTPSSKGLSVFFPSGSASGAIGMRVCTDAALAKEKTAAPWGEKLSAAALEARQAMVRGIGALHPNVLPGQVFVLNADAFPVLAARTWDNQPACWAAGAFCGKGRVFFLATDRASADSGELGKFIGNVRIWLKGGAWFGGVREVAGADLRPEEIPELVEYVKKGGGLLVTGRAWDWWQAELEAKGAASAKDWPGNRLLKAFGILCGRFVVRSDSADGDYSARIGCLAGAAEVQQDVYATQKLESAGEPVETPKIVSDNATRVPSGSKVVFLGDSITRLGNDKGSWIDQVMEGLKKAGAKDLDKSPAGWDGQNAADMAGRVGGLVKDEDVRVMTLSCGVNDVWGYDWNRGVELAEYKRNVRKIYDKAAKEGVLVVAMTPTLIRENPDNDFNRLLEPFATFIREEAARRNLPLADCRKAELEFLKGFPPNSGRHFSMDGVHPIPAGNAIIAREVLKALNAR